jgi:predicted 3-demethylubiquinone-9 3-methyltransferase (glyoxalase superfamily)
MPRIIPNLWFDTQGEQAAEFYTSLFPNSSIGSIARYPEGAPGPEGEVMTVDFSLDGQPFTAINGGPHFTFDEAISFVIEVDDQAELDRYWDALTAEGGEEVQCGWCKDRFGLSWQVVPKGMQELFEDPDKGRAQRAMQAMLGMKKLDIAAMRAAADG